MLNLTTPVTGTAQTGFTAPSYTVAADIAPAINGKQWTVTAVSGAGNTPDVNTVSNPFTFSVFRPVQLKPAPQANPLTGVVKAVPINSYKCITRKGVKPNSVTNELVCRITTTFEIFSGTETYESADIRALTSFHIGALSQLSAGIGDTLVTGTI